MAVKRAETTPTKKRRKTTSATAVTKAKRQTKSKAKATKKAEQPKKRGGRPSLYSPELVAKICDLRVRGYTLRQIEKVAGMPSLTTICTWLAEKDDFLEQWSRADRARAIAMEDELTELMEDSRNDWVEREGKNGQPMVGVDHEHLERTRLRIDTRKWLMSKMAPKRFGKSLALTGKDGGPVQVAAVADVLDEIDGAGTGLPSNAEDE